LAFITRCNFFEARYISFNERPTQGESDARTQRKKACAMKCPSCGSPLIAPAPQCPNCKVSVYQLDAKFGAPPRHTRYLTDRSGRLPLREIKKLRALLRIFEKKFPQSLFSVFVTDQLQDGSISEYTFWLANRAHFSSIDAVGGRNFDWLLGLDLSAGAAAITIGYGLEHYLNEKDLQAALATAQSAFRAGDYARGIRECVEFVMDRMREVAKAHERHSPTSNSVTSADY
jgi:uncharacterized membrane protein YgcG